MTLALGSALIASGGWNLRAIADAFATWMRSDPVDIGNACRRGISHYISNGSLCVPPAEDNGGNGAAMRNLPTVLSRWKTKNSSSNGASSRRTSRTTIRNPTPPPLRWPA